MKILDTDLLIAALRGQPKALEYVRTHDDLATTTINLAELESGAEGSRQAAEGKAKIDVLLASMPIIPFGPRHAKTFGTIARARRIRGLPGGPFDLLIASIALSEGGTIVTRNLKDFEGNEGLLVEAW